MNSTRTTYLPRVMPDNPNLPSEFVATENFFPVNVLAAVTVTPGSGVLPLRAEPLISYAGASAGVGPALRLGGGGRGASSCAREPAAQCTPTKASIDSPPS